MKKILTCFLIIAFSLALAGCQSEKEKEREIEKKEKERISKQMTINPEYVEELKKQNKKGLNP